MTNHQTTISSLSPTDVERLLTAARSARGRAYAPYSKFPVGAAVLTNSGQIIAGCNVENASIGLTNCAERVAIQSAIAAGHRDLIAIAVSVGAPVTSEQERMPCGACRQVMSEFMAPNSVVLIDGAGQFSLEKILPHPFHLELSFPKTHM